MAIFSYPDTELSTQISTVPFYLAVAKGDVPGHTAVNVFGFNRNVGTSFETIWNDGGPYSFLSSAQQLSVVSTSSSDTMDLLIRGLDSNYDQITETVTLTGTASVTTTQSFLRVNNAIILSGSNVGNITGSYSGTEAFYIEATLGTTQGAVYTVPAGHTLYLTRISLTSGTVGNNKYLMYRNVATTDTGRVLRVAEATWQDGMQSFDRQIPFVLQEKTDWQWEAKSSSGSNEVSIFLECFLIEDGY